MREGKVEWYYYTFISWRCQVRALVGEFLLKVESTCLRLDDGDKGRSDPLVVDIVPVDGLEEHMGLDLLCISFSSTQSAGYTRVLNSFLPHPLSL